MIMAARRINWSRWRGNRSGGAAAVVAAAVVVMVMRNISAVLKYIGRWITTRCHWGIFCSVSRVSDIKMSQYDVIPFDWLFVANRRLLQNIVINCVRESIFEEIYIKYVLCSIKYTPYFRWFYQPIFVLWWRYVKQQTISTRIEH